ncbi:hypothetical protein [Pseudomonas sp. TUM22785]|uniref:hypothetical protein n=1 Tax=Pseudomonas sp. TUM22785 TaxID=3019098 RepID=UPI002305708E|nr:hypothetical protein [Pseudomonas sp. TUM22785]WCD79178.1 hypothetical protein PI990_24770 [Pseudomonas sp. TUM22785]
MPDYARIRHSRHLTNWCSAFADDNAWMYRTYEHYGLLRDKANQLHLAGSISMELRNELILDAFRAFQASCNRNTLARSSYQYGHLYDIFEGDVKAGRISCTSHFTLYGPPERGGCINPRYQHDGEWELHGYFDCVSTVFAIVRGMEVELPDGKILRMQLAKPTHSTESWVEKIDR